MLRITRAALRSAKIVRGFGVPADSFLKGENSIYVEQMYSRWTQDRKSVHASWDAYFTNLSNGVDSSEAFATAPETHGEGQQSQAVGGHKGNVLQEKLAQMIRRYRRRAHENADIDPLNIELNRYKYSNPFTTVEADPANYGFKDTDLNKPINFFSQLKGFTSAKKEWTPAEASDILKKIYCGPIGYEFSHIPDIEVQDWIRERIEKVPSFDLTKAEKEDLLDRILESQAFTDFCEKKYSSSKRFGIDGLDSAISGLERLVYASKDHGVSNVILGMAHRGRLNTLACVFNKPYETIFTEFKDPGISKNLKAAEWGFSGDVKYHLGASSRVQFPDGKNISLTMLPNPSHLETVNPVVLGKARSKMDFIGDHEGDKVVTVLIHGDAAISGQGIVYETLQMERLPGYTTQGTVHVVFNNHVGFTTNPGEGRSTPYCTDVMKTNNSFIMHVNADFPEHVDYCFKLAVEYRMKFKRDVVIDISGYRRYGHNEQDMPKFTQPMTYERVEQRLPMWKLYAETLVKQGVFTQAEIDQKYNAKIAKLEVAFEKAKNENFNPNEWDSTTWKSLLKPNLAESDSTAPATGITEFEFKNLGKAINSLPSGKNFHPIIQKVYEQRLKSIETGQGLDWAAGEALAFASLLKEGFGVRLSGEDVRRGTFSHRHACIVDQKDYSRYFPLHSILDKEEELRFQAHNSLLSEYGVLGFDYGYSIGNPNHLTIWEAQFGDFSNVAQPVIDQYIAGGERKWGTKSGLVMLLPHGFDGQGPEHSSARLERFLQLLDDDPYDAAFFEATPAQQAKMSNMTVCNVTLPANYFHLLRRQLHRDFRKPLVVMSPKKLLRLKEAKSDVSEFVGTTKFREVIPEAFPGKLVEPAQVKKVIFCSGQVYFDLADKREQLQNKDTAIVRVEQIAPFPYQFVEHELLRYPNAQVCWAQEEHRNQGAHLFVRERIEVLLKKAGSARKIRYIGRKISGSTAVGSLNTHKLQQAELLEDAFK